MNSAICVDIGTLQLEDRMPAMAVQPCSFVRYSDGSTLDPASDNSPDARRCIQLGIIARSLLALKCDEGSDLERFVVDAPDGNHERQIEVRGFFDPDGAIYAIDLMYSHPLWINYGLHSCDRDGGVRFTEIFGISVAATELVAKRLNDWVELSQTP